MHCIEATCPIAPLHRCGHTDVTDAHTPPAGCGLGAAHVRGMPCWCWPSSSPLPTELFNADMHAVTGWISSSCSRGCHSAPAMHSNCTHLLRGSCCIMHHRVHACMECPAAVHWRNCMTAGICSALLHAADPCMADHCTHSGVCAKQSCDVVWHIPGAPYSCCLPLPPGNRRPRG